MAAALALAAAATAVAHQHQRQARPPCTPLQAATPSAAATSALPPNVTTTASATAAQLQRSVAVGSVAVAAGVTADASPVSLLALPHMHMLTQFRLPPQQHLSPQQQLQLLGVLQAAAALAAATTAGGDRSAAAAAAAAVLPSSVSSPAADAAVATAASPPHSQRADEGATPSRKKRKKPAVMIPLNHPRHDELVLEDTGLARRAMMVCASAPPDGPWVKGAARDPLAFGMPEIKGCPRARAYITLKCRFGDSVGWDAARKAGTSGAATAYFTRLISQIEDAVPRGPAA